LVQLGGLEQQVIAVLWEAAPTEMTVREVSEDFPDHAYTTVLTVLDRLERKGMVRRIRGGRAHRYVPTGSREEYATALMREALRSTPDPNAALAFFAGSVSPEEAEVLREILRWKDSGERRRRKEK
jgi:predicted transcriptional regulator